LYLLGGAAAAITLLYILKLRRRRVEVPFAALWARLLVEKQTSALWRRLRRLFSLLVALLIAALLVLAAGDPRQINQGQDGRTIVLLLDSSASMRALDEGRSRLDIAKEEAKKITSDLGRDDVAMVVRFDRHVVPVSPFSQDDRALAKAIDEIQPADTGAEPLRALSFAADALRGRPNPVVVLLSDGAFGPEILPADLPTIPGAKLHFIQTGKEGENVGIVAFNARRLLSDRLSYMLYVEAKNFGKSPQSVDVTLYLGDKPFDAQRILMQPGATVSRFYTPDVIGIDAGEGRLRAQISPAEGSTDLFPGDNVAYATIPKRQVVRVLIASSKDNFFLEGVLYSEGDSLDVERTTCDKLTPEEAQKFTVLVLDHCAPAWAKEAPGNFFYFDPPEGEGAPFARAKAPALLPKLGKVSKKHPLLRWVSFVDVTILQATPFVGLSADQSLVEGGGGTLLAAQRKGERRVVALAFDVALSELPLRVAFPVLIQNALAWFTDDDASFVSNYQTGETWYVPVSAEVETALVREPSGATREIPLYDHKAVFTGQSAGFYTITAGAEVLEVAANLNNEIESRLSVPESPPVPGAVAGAPEGGGAIVRREIWISLVLAAVAILLVEWWTFHRRVTV
jgi:hypothetical protein